MTDTVLPLAVVTGGAGDIGQAISRALALSGFRIVLADLVDMDHGTALAKTIIDTAGNGASYVRCDHTKPGDVETLFAGNEDIALLVAAAGTVVAQPFLSIDLDSWKKQIDVNLTGSFIVAQKAAQHMAERETRGHVIFISSWVASNPWPEITAYTASKAGLDQLMRQMALELAPRGIRANAVAPGIVLAGLAKHQLETEPEYARRVESAIPLGSLQTAEDIASAVAFLASVGASTMTGSVITVDAGCSLGQVR
jgi:NAD(P)-dependent dehydrogenase (short-subunit alcohol dehydrogenase family)